MTINKLYSKKILLFKLLYVVILPFLTELFAMLFDTENPIIFLFAILFLLALLYAIPFLFTLKELRRTVLDQAAGESVRKIILSDFLFLFVPIVISTIVCDSIFLILDSSSKGQGIFSALVISIVILTTLAFWVLYRILKKKTK